MRELDLATARAEWETALADAALERPATLLLSSDADAEGSAVHFPPGEKLQPDALITEDLARQGNDHLDKHRVAVLCVVPEGEPGRALFAAKLRHELQHAKQWERWGPMPQKLGLIIEEAVDAATADHRTDRMFYRASPSEADCNAAASTYMESRFPTDVLDVILNSEDHVLAGAKVAPDMETLPARSVAYLYQFAHVADRFSEPENGDVRTRLAAISERALALWDELNRSAGDWPRPEAR